MPTQTPEKRKLFTSTLKRLSLGVLVGVLGLIILAGVHPHKTAALTLSTINFQAKLMTASGAVAADNNYNVEFKLYNAGGTNVWTEDWLNNASQGVRVVNGYLTVNLGQYNAFGSSINWDQDLYLGMTVRGTASCSFSACTPADAEMTPRLKLTATPYAFSAGKLSQYNATSGFTSSLTLQGPGVGSGTQTFQIQDQGSAGTYDILTTPHGTDGYVKLQTGTPGTQQSGNININGTVIANSVIVQGTNGLTSGNINTVAGSNTVLGNATGTFQLASSGGLNVSTTGALTGISTIATSGTINGQTISSTANFTGTVGVSGLLTTSGGISVAAGQNITFAGATGNFDQSASSGTFATGSGAVSVNGDTTLAAGKSLTLSSGTGTINQSYTATSGAGTFINAINNSTTGGSVTGLNLGVIGGNGSGTNTTNALNISNALGTVGDTYNAINLGTGYTNLLTYNGTQLVSGTGIFQNAGFSSGINYSNLQQVTNLTASTLASGTVAVNTANGLTLGVTGTATGGIVFKGATASSGSITLVGQTNQSGAVTLTIPSLSGNATICTTDAVCGLASGTNNYLTQVPSSNTANAAGANIISPTGANIVGLTINGTSGTAATAAVINQNQTADALQVNATGGSGTNGINFIRSGSGTTSSGISINQTGGTLTNGLSFSGTIGTDINRASGILSIQGTGGVTVQAGTTNSVVINTAGAGTIALGDTNSTTINLGRGSDIARTINIGNFSGATTAQTVNLGSNGSTSTTTIFGGVNGTTPTVSLQAATGGYIAVGTTNANTLQIGAVGTTANASTVHIADTTGNAAQTITIGSTTNAASVATLQGGGGASAINLVTGATGGTTITSTAPASSAGAGTNAGAVLTVTGAKGGATSGTTTTAGSGSSIGLTAGAGGNATDATANTATAGAGGGLTFTAGAGGTNSSTGNRNGAAGGGLTFTSGQGGNATGTGISGNGGTISIQGGAAGTGGSTAGSIGQVTIQNAGGNVDISNGAFATTIQIGTGAAVKAVSIGSTNGTSTLGLQGGTGTSAISLTTGAGGGINLTTGNNGSGTAGTVTIDTGTSSTGTSNISIGGTNAGSITIGKNGATATVYGNITIGNGAGSGTTLTNNGGTINTTLAITGLSSSGAIGTAGATVDIYTSFTVTTSTNNLVLTVPSPTASTAYGRIIYVSNVNASNVFTLNGSPLRPGATGTLIWTNTSGGASWTFAGADNSSILNQLTQQTGANFNIDGTGTAATFKAANIDAATSGALNIGSAGTATSILVGGTANSFNTTVQANLIVGNGNTGSNSALQVQNSTGSIAVSVNTNTNTTNFATISAPSGTPTVANSIGGALTATTTYFYKITAIDANGGETTASLEGSGATTSTNKVLNVSWNAVAGAVSYRVYRGTASNGENVYYSAGSNSFSDSGATSTAGSPPSTNSATNLHISASGLTTGGTLSSVVANSSTTSPQVLIQQNGSGDATIQLQNATKSYFVGVDSSNSGKFTISSSAASASGLIPNAVLGYNPGGTGANTDSGDSNFINCTQFVSTITGTVTSLQAYVAATISSSPNNKFQMALYTDTANTPGALVQNSASGTLTGNAWNVVNLTATVTTGAKYWICYNTNGTASGANDLKSDVTTNLSAFSSSSVPFGTWPSSVTVTNQNGTSFLMYANVATGASSYDTFGKSLLTLGETGQTTFQNSTDSTAAFQVQNASGTNIFTVDTTNSKVGTIDTTAASTNTQTLTIQSGNATGTTSNSGNVVIDVGTATGTKGTVSIGTTNASAVNVGNSGAVVAIQGSSASVKAATDASTAFTVQNSVGANQFTVDTSNTGSSLNLVTNGGAETGSPPTGWSGQNGGSVAAGTGTDAASGSQSAKITFNTTQFRGGRDTFVTAPTGSTTANYLVSFSVKQVSGTAISMGNTSGSANLQVVYSPDNGTTLSANCTNYSTSATLSTTVWTKVTCSFVPGVTGVTTALLIFRQMDTPGTARVIDIDNLSVVQQNSTGTQDTGIIRIGGALSQGLTLLQLDTYAATPFTGANAALAGAMYFDTTAGKMQCYDGNNWGACGAAPNSNITLTPEYAGAVLDGTGIGTLTSDFCANQSSISFVVGTLCASGDARNFYRWTSPQGTSQAYSMYVTYKLPSTFKAFVAGTTSLTGEVDNTSNAAVKYAVYRKANAGGITSCSVLSTVVGWNGASAVGSANTWTTGVAGTLTGTTDLTGCGFVANDSVIFQITVNSLSNANAYAENLNFQFSNQ